MTDTTEDNGAALAQDELATLKARADMLGVTYHPKIGLETLREKINAAVTAEGIPKEVAAPVASASVAAAPSLAAPVAAVETENQMKRRLKNDATRLVRIRLSCMNPAKKEWQGEVFTVGNSVVGSITKFVPFEAEDGYHVPHILYETLVARQCQVFVNVKQEVAGRIVTVRKGKLIREFAIEVLPQLTEGELKDLAARQAATHAID